MFITGEVGQPGAFPIPRPMSMLEALALPGGTRPTANIDSVVTVSRCQHKAIVRVFGSAIVDCKSKDLACLQPDDLLFVPKTRLARANEVMRQLVGALLFNGISYTSSYRVGERDVEIRNP